MVASNYSTPDMPGMDTATPVTPVDKTIINAVGSIGETLIEQRKAANEATDAQFLQQGGEYFRNINQQIANDPVRAEALLYADLEANKGSLTEEGSKELARLSTRFNDLNDAKTQGMMSKYNHLARAQSMITDAIMRRPDLGDEIRLLASKTLGSEVLNVSDLIYSMKFSGMEQEKERKDGVRTRVSKMLEAADKSSDPGYVIKQSMDALALIEKGDYDGASAIADTVVKSAFGGSSVSGTLIQDAKTKRTEFYKGFGADSDFVSKITSPNAEVRKQAFQTAVSELEAIDNTIAQLEAVPGTQATEAKAEASQLKLIRTYISNIIDTGGDPVKMKGAIDAGLWVTSYAGNASAKEAFSRAMPYAKQEDSGLIAQATIGQSKLQDAYANPDGVVYEDKTYGQGDWNNYNRLTSLWSTEKAPTQSQLNGSVDLTAMVIAGYSIPVINKTTGNVVAASPRETKLVFSNLNRSFYNTSAQLSGSFGNPDNIDKLFVARAAAWDKSHTIIAASLPPEYAKDYVLPDTVTYGMQTAKEGGKTVNTPGGLYTGNDPEGFKKAYNKILVDNNIAAEWGKFYNDQKSLEALLNSKTGKAGAE
jgi:hypothetical protein